MVFLFCISSADDGVLGANLGTGAAGYALVLVQSPGLVGAVHGDGAFGTLSGTQGAVNAGVAAGQLTLDISLEAGAAGNQIGGIGGYHVVVTGEFDGIGGAEMAFGSITISGIGLAALVGVILNLILPRNKTK